MAKVGYIMAAAHYDRYDQDKQWMSDYGCINIIEEQDQDEKERPEWKQLILKLQRGDTLVISKFSNALRSTRELAMFLELCRVKVIRIVSINDRIDSANELFPDTRPGDVLQMVGSLASEALVMRKASSHVLQLRQTRINPSSPLSSSSQKRKDRDSMIINMYQAGHSIDDIWTASGFNSRSSVFRILRDNGIESDRKPHRK